KHIAQRLLHIFRNRPHHTKIDEGYHRTIRAYAALDKDIAWMRVRVKKALLKKLVEVGLHGALGDFQAIDTCRIKRRVVVNLDAIYPLQHQHAPRDILFIDARNIHGRIIREHVPEALTIGGLRHIIYLFIDGALELAIDPHQVNKVARVDEAHYHPDHAFEGA